MFSSFLKSVLTVFYERHISSEIFSFFKKVKISGTQQTLGYYLVKKAKLQLFNTSPEKWGPFLEKKGENDKIWEFLTPGEWQKKSHGLLQSHYEYLTAYKVSSLSHQNSGWRIVTKNVFWEILKIRVIFGAISGPIFTRGSCK